jgi:chemotaxis methyl-accepting protein methylase
MQYFVSVKELISLITNKPLFAEEFFRMAINKKWTTADYLNYLRQNKPEQDALYQDFFNTCNVIFRDSAVFDNLCSKVFLP